MDMKVIDMSHSVTNGMPVFPGIPPVVLKPIATVDSDGFNELHLELTTHIGTHIDCPRHIFNGGFDTTEEISKFFGKGIVINCLDTGPEIPFSYIKKMETLIDQSEFVLLYTGWDKYWSNSGYFENFPVLSIEAVDYLLKFPLKGTGIDAPSFDRIDSVALPVHNRLLGKGVILIENLTNLQGMMNTHFMFSCLPLKIENGDGCPVRAAGIIN
jgi:arylformamidase